MSVTDLLFNKVAVGIYALGMSLLIYLELKNVWGMILVGLALVGGVALLGMLANEALAYVLIYGGYGLLVSATEWAARRKKRGT